MIDKLDMILERHKKVEQKLLSEIKDNSEFIKISKEYAHLKPVVEVITKFKKIKNEITSLKSIISSGDKELQEIANLELENEEKALKEAEYQVQIALLPKDEDDERNAILEKIGRAHV